MNQATLLPADVTAEGGFYLAAAAGRKPTERESELIEIAIRRIGDALRTGSALKLARWRRFVLHEAPNTMDEIVRAASHAVAWGCGGTDPRNLPGILESLEAIECEVITGKSADRPGLLSRSPPTRARRIGGRRVAAQA